MPRIETSLEIRRPQEAVFAYLSDVRNAKEWTTGLVDVTYDGQLAEGTTGSDTRLFGRREMVMPWKVVAFDPPNRAVFEYSAPFPMTAEFSFRRTASGTMVTCTTDLRPRGLWRLLAPFMAREGRKTDQEQFAKAREILESRSADDSPAVAGG